MIQSRKFDENPFIGFGSVMLMRKREMNKKIVFALVLIVAISTLSIITVKPVSAQTSTSSSGVPKPFVPIFSLKYVNSSYSISTTSTNPYTGANVVKTNTYINNTIEVVIENQPFDATQSVAPQNGAPQNGNITNLTYLSLYYIVQEKGHFANQWNVGSPVLASNSEYTTVNFGFTGENGSLGETLIAPVPNGGQVDFQVEAVIGWYGNIFQDENGMIYDTPQFNNVTSSGWSNTLTITIPSGAASASISSTSSYPTLSPTAVSTANSTLTSTNPTATPQNPTVGVQDKTGAGFNWTQIALLIALAVIVALVVIVVAMTFRHRKTANSADDANA